MKKLFRLAVPALAIVAVGCGGGGKPPQMPPTPVEIAPVRSVVLRDSSEYVATLKSRASAVIQPQVEGHVARILVHSGDAVLSGALLVEIDPAKQQATLRSQDAARAAQESQVRLALEQKQRAEKLFAGGAISKQDLDSAVAAFENARAQLEALEAQVKEQQVELNYYRVNSPWSGIVGDIPVRVGDYVNSSTKLTTIDQRGALEVYVSVPVEHARDLKPGLAVDLVDGAGSTLGSTQISYVAPQVDSDSQTILAKALIANDDGRFRTAQIVRARIVWTTHTGPVVPVVAVTRLNGQMFVFAVESEGGNLTVHQRAVTLGEIDGNDREVLSGLKPGDRIVVGGIQKIFDGARVVSAS